MLLSGIFDGEDVDARLLPRDFEPAVLADYPKRALIPQEGPEIREQETVYPRRSFRTPKGEWVLDFGQNLTGYMAFEVDARAGEKLSISTAEVLDAEGNFYTDNYRFARSQLHYVCREGHQSYKPRFTFFGFRYLRLDEAPAGFSAEDIRAVVVHSEMTRTGWLETEDAETGERLLVDWSDDKTRAEMAEKQDVAAKELRVRSHGAKADYLLFDGHEPPVQVIRRWLACP